MDIEALAAKLGINIVSGVSGFFGALLAALRAQNQTRTEKVLSFLTGVGFAMWLPAVVMKWFKIDDDPAIRGALGFVLGYFGMSLMDALTAAMQQLRQVDFKKIIEGWLERK